MAGEAKEGKWCCLEIRKLLPTKKPVWRFREDISTILRESRNFGIITPEMYNNYNKYAEDTNGKSGQHA